MSNIENKENVKWNSEQSHEEKKERIEALKLKDGSKKSLLSGNLKLKVSVSVVAVLLVLSILSWILYGLGIPQKYLSAGSINGDKVSIAEYNYIYNYTYDRFNQYAANGLTSKKADGNIDLDTISPFNEDGVTRTWGETLEYVTQDQLKRIKYSIRKAKELGLQLTEEDSKEIDDIIDNGIKQSGSQLAFENHLVSSLGKGADITTYRKIIEDNMLAAKYAEKYMSDLSFSSDEINKEYEQNKDLYDTVTYREFSIAPAYLSEEESKLPEDEKKKLLQQKNEQAEKQISDFYSLVETTNPANREAVFKSNITAFVSEDMKENSKDDNFSLRAGLNKSSLPENMAQWLFAADRHSNDVVLLDEAESHTKKVLLFLHRGRNESDLKELGVLVFNNNIKVTDKNKDVAKKSLEEYKAKAMELASKITDKASLDNVSKQLKDEGLNIFANWYPAASLNNLPLEIADWFKSNLKAGDYKLVEDPNYAYLSLYVFKSDLAEKAWEKQVKNKLGSLLFQDDMEKALKDQANDFKFNTLAKYFLDLRDKGTKTAADVKKADEAKLKESGNADAKVDTKDQAKDGQNEKTADKKTSQGKTTDNK